MKEISINTKSLAPYKSNSLVRATNALEITNKLINEKANNYFVLGKAMHYIKDYNSAIENYSKAIEFNPSLTNAYYNRGTIKNYLKNFRGAIEDYSKAIELNPIYN